jgi:predicted PurR-regulated permease PerM
MTKGVNSMRSSKLMLKLLRWLMSWLRLPLVVLNGWAILRLMDYFRTPLKILIVGALVAFLLGHPLRWMERHGVKKVPAVGLILAGVLIILGLLGITLVPILVSQAKNLANDFSTLEQSASDQFQALDLWLQRLGLPVNISDMALHQSNQLLQQLQATAARLPRVLEGAIGGVFEAFLIIVVMLYLLLRGASLWHGIFEWLPTRLGTQLQTALPRSFRNYFIGQGTVALMLGSLLALVFTLFRIPYGFLFGVVIGALALFPYGGTIGIALVSLLLALKSIWLGLTVLAIATVIDQIVENGVAPRLMGHLTGLHPVWVVMAILVGGKIAGLLGVVLAVPIASTVKETLEIYKPKRASTLAIS